MNQKIFDLMIAEFCYEAQPASRKSSLLQHDKAQDRKQLAKIFF